VPGDNRGVVVERLEAIGSLSMAVAAAVRAGIFSMAVDVHRFVWGMAFVPQICNTRG
jgi:hypothetical protein